MSHRKRLSRVLSIPLVALLTVGILGAIAGPASAAPYKCVFVTDPQGNVIDTICIPWPLG